MCVHTCSTPVFVAIGTVPTNFPKSTKEAKKVFDSHGRGVKFKE